MALKELFQKEIELGKLYEVHRLSVTPGEAEQINTSLYINTGTVDVYGYNGSQDPETLTLENMTLNKENKEVSGMQPFASIPTYIAIVQNTGVTTELILSGLKSIEVGVIS